MQIIDDHVALLSDYEVWDHLCKQRQSREELAATLKHPPRMSANVLTIEYEVSAGGEPPAPHYGLRLDMLIPWVLGA